MAEPRTIANYGGPYQDARAIENPEVEMASDEGNRLLEDVAQMTRPACKARVWFTATDTAAPVASITPTAWRTQWGSGAAQKPTVSKPTGDGLYTITFATTYDDALGVTEAVSFIGAKVTVWTSDSADIIDGRPLTVSGAVATIALYDDAGAGLALNDHGTNSSELLKVQVDLY